MTSRGTSPIAGGYMAAHGGRHATLAGVLVVAVLTVLAGGCRKAAGPDAAALRRSYSITPGKDWVTREAGDGLILSMHSPKADPNGTFPENVTVTAMPLAKSVTVGEFVELNRPSMIRMLSGFAQQADGNATLGGLAAKWIVCTFDKDGLQCKAKVYFVVRGNGGYVIMCTAPPEAFDKSSPTFQQVIDTFKFK